MSIYGKVPPQNIEIEKQVLGVILLEPGAYEIAAGIIKHHFFYTDAHKKIFQSIASLAADNRPIDMMTLSERLIKNGQLKDVGDFFYLTQLTDKVTSSASLEIHCRIIYEKFVKRELARVSQEINTLSYDDGKDPFELLEQAEAMLSDIGSNSIEAGMTHIGQVVERAFNQIEKWKEAGTALTGIPTGFEGLNVSTRGWQPGDLIILGARPSVGKTAFALNLVREAAKTSTVAVWSLEMKAIFLVLRMLAAESNTFLYKLQTGRLTDEELATIRNKAGARLSQLNVFFDDKSSVSLSTITRKARRLKKMGGLGLIVVDYLQLMSGEEKTGNREQEISKISRGLKNLAQELEVPIIALSQLGREMGSKAISWENGPGINSLRESGAIEQDADVILMLWGASDAEISNDAELENRRKVRIAKQRNGALITEELHFANEIQMFKKIEEATSWRPVNNNPDQFIQPSSPDAMFEEGSPF